VLVTHDQEERWRSPPDRRHEPRRVEQIGAPAEIYDRPASDFVMGFVGKVNRPGRLHPPPRGGDLRAGGPGPATAVVERLLALGFETRVELRLRGDGQRLWAQLTGAVAGRLALAPGQTVGVDLSRGRRFGAADGEDAVRRAS
jgi:sulfate transport system ATP-binding protein